MATLLVGTSYGYTHEISRYVFPFTPVELHAGYLLGQERIISIHSGNYGWPGERCLVQVRHFDKDGKLTGKDFPSTVSQEARTQVELAEGEAVVLERLPVTVQPKAGLAEATAVRYDADGLSFTLKASGGATVKVGNGLMELAPAERFFVKIGDRAGELASDKVATLYFDIKADVPTRVSICRAPR